MVTFFFFSSNVIVFAFFFVLHLVYNNVQTVDQSFALSLHSMVFCEMIAAVLVSLDAKNSDSVPSRFLASVNFP